MVAPPSPPYIPAKYQGGRQSVLKRIVLHGTVSKTYCGGAKAIARYFQNPSAPSSAHYVTDPCSVYQCVYDHTIAWHDGTNTNSIGVEMCDLVAGPAGRWQDGPHQDMLRITANLVRQLCLAYGIPMVKLSPEQIRAGHKGICGHVDMRDAFPGSTTHWDPGPDFPWSDFMRLVTASGGGAAPSSEEDEMPYSEHDLQVIAYRGTVTAWQDAAYHPDTHVAKAVRSALEPVLAPVREQVAALTDLVGRQSGVTAEDIAAALRTGLAADLGPVLREVVTEALGDDNGETADLIASSVLDKLGTRLTEGSES